MSELFEFFKTAPQFLNQYKVGVEKEGLRATSKGILSNRPHPLNLGSKLTHPFITTDYAESLLEFITSAWPSFELAQQQLYNLHAFTIQNNPEEVIWPMSMPCELPADDQIQVAHYGSSNVGRLKELYRIGLGNRYGRSMQSIAGLHYNFSLGEKLVMQLRDHLQPGSNLQNFQNKLYFRIIRNYRRYNWLLAYLFGSTPCVDKSFLVGKKHDLEQIGPDTYGSQYATSLRMGGLGYTSNAQENIRICYNGLSTYIRTIEEARLTSYPEYEKIGLFDANGKRKQLNTNLIQIDNEFYSTIRPKHPARSGQSALGALYEGGVEYIELRIMDLDPFSASGISLQTGKFLHLFVLTCLSMTDQLMEAEECAQNNVNLSKVVKEGRKIGITLKILGKEKSLQDHALEFLQKAQLLAELLDPNGEQDLVDIVSQQKAKILDSKQTPSYKVLELSKQQGHIGLGCALAKEHFQNWLTTNLGTEFVQLMNELTQKSLAEQLEIENADSVDFEQFLKQYFDQIKIHW